MHTSFFLSNFVFQSAYVTLKIRSRSPKFNLFFPLSDVSVPAGSDSSHWLKG